MSQTQTKEVFDELMSEWKTFRDKNEKRLEKIEQGDTTRAKELDQQLDKVADRIDELEMKQKKAQNREPDLTKAEIERKAFEDFAINGNGKVDFSDYAKAGKFSDSIASEVKSLSSDSGPDGGFFNLPNFSDEVIKGIREKSPVRQVARVFTLNSGDSLTWRVRNNTISSQNAGERENVSDTDTQDYKKVTIQTHEHSASPAITRQLIEDADIDIVRETQNELIEQFAVQEGTDFINGSGVDEAEGILTNTDVSSTASGSNTAFDFDDLITLQGELKDGYNGAFMFSRQTRAYILKLKDNDNQYLWQPNLAADAPNTILGDPYFLATVLASPSGGSFSAGDVPVLYGDYQRGYFIVDRLGLDVLRDPYSNRPFVEFYTRRRYGGQVVLPEAIKKLTTTT